MAQVRLQSGGVAREVPCQDPNPGLWRRGTRRSPRWRRDNSFSSPRLGATPHGGCLRKPVSPQPGLIFPRGISSPCNLIFLRGLSGQEFLEPSAREISMSALQVDRPEALWGMPPHLQACVTSRFSLICSLGCVFELRLRVLRRRLRNLKT